MFFFCSIIYYCYFTESVHFTLVGVLVCVCVYVAVIASSSMISLFISSCIF